MHKADLSIIAEGNNHATYCMLGLDVLSEASKFGPAVMFLRGSIELGGGLGFHEELSQPHPSLLNTATCARF